MKCRLNEHSTNRIPVLHQTPRQQQPLPELLPVGLAQFRRFVLHREGALELRAHHFEAPVHDGSVGLNHGAAGVLVQIGLGEALQRPGPLLILLSRNAVGQPEPGWTGLRVGQIDEIVLAPQKSRSPRLHGVAHHHVGRRLGIESAQLAGHDGADGGVDDGPAGHPARVYEVDRLGVFRELVVQRPHEGEAVHSLRDPGQVLANPDTRHAGLDGVVVASRDLLAVPLEFGVEGVDMTHAPRQPDENTGVGGRSRPCLGVGSGPSSGSRRCREEISCNGGGPQGGTESRSGSEELSSIHLGPGVFHDVSPRAGK